MTIRIFADGVGIENELITRDDEARLCGLARYHQPVVVLIASTRLRWSGATIKAMR